MEARSVGVVGRAGPLARLDDVVSASARGRRAAVLVSGQAGIGKTSLVRAAIELSAPDAVVGWGTCWQGGGAPGFWPWTQALGGLLRAVGPDAARSAAGPDRDRLSVLIRDLGPLAGTSTDPVGHRLLLLDAAARWLASMARDRHVVVVLDDLQWADPSTLDLLDHVLAAPVAARLLLVAVFRHDEIEDETRARFATLGSHADNVHLEGLSLDGVEDLVEAVCGDQAAARRRAPELHRRTGGHPLFVSELARLPEGGAGVLPTVVTGAVARRLEALPDAPRRILEVASVLGNRLLPDVLGAVVEKSPAAVVAELDAAIVAGLIRATPDDEFWFAHDLFRETLYGLLGATRRSELHALVGDALEARSVRGAQVQPSDLARHFAQASRQGDGAKALHWAREAAADERRRSAFTEAAHHLRRAREAVVDAGGSIEPELLVELLMQEADDRARAGDPHDARNLLSAAARSSSDPAHRADVALAVQRLGAKFAAPRDAIIQELEAALEAVTDVDVARQARVTAALARELQHSVPGERARAEPLSQRAIALGRRSRDEGTLVACLLARHDALWYPGSGAERARLAHEIAALGNRLGDTDRVAEGLILEASGLLESGSAGFRPILERWFVLLGGRDEPRDRYMVATRRAALALLDDDIDLAATLMHEAATAGERIREPDTGNVLMSQRVALEQARDDPHRLRSLADDAVRWWTGAPVLAHGVAAGAYAAAGDLEAAERAVAMVTACGGWRSEDSYMRSVLVTHLAGAATALGDAELCRDLLAAVDTLTDSSGVNGAFVAFAGPFAHTAGILAGALGDQRTAERLLSRSMQTARRLGATAWIRRGEAARVRLRERPSGGRGAAGTTVAASLRRAGTLWTISWDDERGHLSHAKGLADIAELVDRPGREVSALELAGGTSAAAGSSDQLIDAAALAAYRARLTAVATEIERARDVGDLGRAGQLEVEREQILAEVRRTTGLGGRIRTGTGDPAERARKAVTARIRDAIRRLDEVAPRPAAHLDRSIRTGLHCSYVPTGDDTSVHWDVRS